MEEKKVAEVEDFPVNKTESLESFCMWAPQNCKEVFDSTKIKEVREACLKQINSDFENNVNWLAERVKAYLKICDYETVCMLLRVLCRHQWAQSQRIVDLMVTSVRFGMIGNIDCARRNIKDMLVILCGKLQHSRGLYNKNTRKLFQEIIEKLYVYSVYDSEEESFRLITRVLYIVASAKDKYFIPILERMDISKKELEHLMKYAHISKERIGFEGLKMIILRHLKSK